MIYRIVKNNPKQLTVHPGFSYVHDCNRLKKTHIRALIPEAVKLMYLKSECEKRGVFDFIFHSERCMKTFKYVCVLQKRAREKLRNWRARKSVSIE